MSFKAKTDYCGLAATYSAALQTRDDKENLSSQSYRPVSNEGEIFANEIFGDDSAPSNTYGLKAKLEATGASGKPAKLCIGAAAVTTVGDKKYGLESVQINTGAGTPVAISAVAQELEEGASAANAIKFEVPAFTVETRHKAQDIFGAISAIVNATMTSCNAQIACTISKDKIAGTKVSSDCNSGLITITGTLLQKSTANDAAAVSLTVAAGWTLDQAPNRTNPESAYPEYAFTITRALEIYTAPANS